MSKCEKHGVDHVKQDAGRGKWIPVCPECEEEIKAKFASMFAPMTFGFHPTCGTHHDLSQCPVGAPEAEVERKGSE